MSDNANNDDDFSLNEGGAEPEQAAQPKAKGPGPGILKILTIIGIAIGAVGLIVTVVVITVNHMNQQGKPATEITTSDEYGDVPTPIYQYSTLIGEIRTRTNDVEPASVVAKITIGLDANDKETPTELTARQYQIRDMLRQYFSSKSASELGPTSEATVKEEIKEKLNNMLTKNGAIKEVLFESFTVIQ